jgi:hypothetical protein
LRSTDPGVSIPATSRKKPIANSPTGPNSTSSMVSVTGAMLASRTSVYVHEPSWSYPAQPCPKTTTATRTTLSPSRYATRVPAGVVAGIDAVIRQGCRGTRISTRVGQIF